MKKENHHWLAFIFLAIVALASNIYFSIAIQDMREEERETNRLLSQFQRIDTVKPDLNAEQIPIPGKVSPCPKWVHASKDCIYLQSNESADDPNICDKWSSENRGDHEDVICGMNLK